VGHVPLKPITFLKEQIYMIAQIGIGFLAIIPAVNYLMLLEPTSLLSIFLKGLEEEIKALIQFTIKPPITGLYMHSYF
jgi:hypothetical protein